MKEILVTGRTLPEGYHKALMALYEQGDTVPCPDYHTEQKEVSMTMVIDYTYIYWVPGVRAVPVRDARRHFGFRDRKRKLGLYLS